jgi:hypothetical protein
MIRSDCGGCLKAGNPMKEKANFTFAKLAYLVGKICKTLNKKWAAREILPTKYFVITDHRNVTPPILWTQHFTTLS